MYEFFENIADCFGAVVDFVVSMIANFIMIIKLIGRSMVVVFNVIVYMPVTIQAILIALISYIIIINVMKKGG